MLDNHSHLSTIHRTPADSCGSSVERPPRSLYRDCPPEPTRSERARAAIDKQVFERAMNRLRRITLLLGAALAAVIARIVVDGPKLSLDLTGALILLLLAWSVALRRHGRRRDPDASSEAERVDAR
jgi:hypothetical protein